MRTSSLWLYFMLVVCYCHHFYHSNQNCKLIVHENEEPVLEGIQHYPIILLIVTGENNHQSEVICDDSSHNPNGPRDWPNMTFATDAPQEDKLTDLRGNYLRISVLESLPLTKINGSNVSGYFVDVLDILADLMHFQVVYQRPPDGLWGSKNDDGTWNGMVGELTNNQSDISIGGLSITEDRSQVIDFTYPLIDDDVTLNYRVLEPAELDFQAFFQVFQSGTWISVGVAFILVVIGLCLTSQMGPNKLGILRSCEITWVNFILRDPNGHDHFANTSSLFSYKIWFAIMSLFSLIVMTVYTGDLTSKMTASGPVDDLTSFQDIIDRKWQLLLKPGTSIYDHVARSIEGSALKNVFQNQLFDNELDLPLADVLLSNWNVAHIGTKSMFINQPEIHSVKVPGTWSELIGFGVPKDWPHLRTMNYHIQRLREFGILAILKGKWFDKQTADPTGTHTESFSISYQHTLFPFILLLLFCGISIFLGALERLLPRSAVQLS
ncbi:probable glutamate receptor [Tigriopus californicus]|uniref:probable glutamate receptor n=1 Tax=Tigriopus californicus TaxID=6832 RepID=UPI0027DA5986|nr:probable glutamate receptor [Tigriopus californicus]